MLIIRTSRGIVRSYTSKRKFVVAKKGVKGFHLSDKIDENTYICPINYADNRLPTTGNLYEVVMYLTGGHNEGPIPCRFICNKETDLKAHNRVVLPEIDMIFKMCESISESNSGVYTARLVANDNSRYIAEVNEEGTISKLIKLADEQLVAKAC